MADAKITPQADEWSMVSDGSSEPETKIVMEKIGDAFVGDRYLGMRTVPSADGNYQQARWQNGDEIFFMNANYSLREGLKNVRIGSKTRVTWVDELDTGQPSPMRVYSVETARRVPGRTSS